MKVTAAVAMIVERGWLPCPTFYLNCVSLPPLFFPQRAPEDLPQVVPRAATMASEVPLPTVYWMREAELKHGRLCMLAICGFVAVDTGAHWPGTGKPPTRNLCKLIYNVSF